MRRDLQKTRERQTTSLLLKTFMLLAMLVTGSNAWGIGLSKEIPLPGSNLTNDKGAWTASTKTLSWTDGYSNAIDVAAYQDLSSYKGITVDSYNLTAGATFRILLISGSNNYQYVMNTAGVHQILFSDFKIDGTETTISNEELKNAKIQMAGRYGGEGTRSVKINRLGLIQVKWWGDRKVTISDPNDFTDYGTSHTDNTFTFDATWKEARIFLDASNANEIGAVTLNTSDNSKVKIGGWMSGTRDNGGQWYPTLEAAKAANAKITELDIQVTETGTYTINSVTFTQPCEVVYSTTVDVPTGCDWWYTVGDDDTPIKETRKFAEGTKIIYHATDTGNDHKMINGWKDSEWKNWGATYTVNPLSSDLNIIPEFQDCFRVFAQAENGATATVNKTGKFFQKVEGLTFTTTVPTGYTFDGWYNGSSRLSGENPYNYGTYQPGNGTDDLTLTAKFKENVLTIGKPQCNHYGDRTHGDNYFDIQRLNPLNGVTIGTADNGTGRKINVPTNGGAVKFVFDNAYNLACLVGWTISENEGLRNRVSCIEFYTDEDCTNRIADFWDGGQIAGNRSGINDSRLNKDIKAIRISFKTGEAVSYDIDWIRFSFEHRDNQLPTLTNGTSSEMVAYHGVGESLTLSNTPGYWRQFTDETYETEKHDDLIPEVYSSNYTFDIDSKMDKGDYYFGARDGVWCSLGYNHGQTELVKVHVNVTDPPTGLKVTYNLNGGDGAIPTDDNRYVYKANAPIKAPGSITKEGHYFGYWSLNPDGSGDKYSTDPDLGRTSISMTGDITLYAIWNKIGFGGWFNFENRLIAQWNFDLSDEVRLNLPTLNNSTYWTKTEPETNKILYTYTGGALNYDQLTYDGTNVIPMAAGLKFKASGEGTQKVQILVTKDGTGKIDNVQFVFDNGVKLDVPYVRNSYRNDKGSDYAPYQWEGSVEDPTWNYFDPGTSETNEGFVNFQDCLHHLNRDIVYIVSTPDVFPQAGASAITNLCADSPTDPTKTLFNNGGDENVKGLPEGKYKTWRKCNFTGTQGERCIIEFAQKTTVDRIAVNRNLVYSFYTENTAVTTDGIYDKPFPGMRLVGNPRGQRVANVGGTWTEYTGAIAVTFGGWPHNGNEYKDGDNNPKKDTWGALNVYQGKHSGINGGAELEGNRDYSVDYSKIDVTKVPFATDGFPVYSRMTNPAYSETVNPQATEDNQNIGLSYHDRSYGQFLLHELDGGDNDHTYLENYNPWTLPARGAYVKFEPTYPGVLNVDVLQDGGQTYYIADEFGRLVKDNVYTKVGQEYRKIDGTVAGHFTVADKSYVKYSFNVYPGKTYYLFSNQGGLGVSGFYFEPYVYRKYNSKPETTYAEEDFELSRINVGIKTASMYAGPEFYWIDTTNDAMDYTNQAAHTGVTKLVNPTNERNKRHEDPSVNLNPAEGEFAAIHKNTNPHIVEDPNDINYVTLDNKAVHVTLDRSFTANKWQTICLPYSMNNLQLEKVFGEGTKVVLMRDVQEYDKKNLNKTTVYFVAHMNQDILAGYPYLIFPTKDITKVEANVYLNDDTGNITGEWNVPAPISISGLGQNLVTYEKDNVPSNPTLNNYGGMPEYIFKSTYKDIENGIPAKSYVVSNNKLTRVPSPMKAIAFKAYIDGAAASSAKMINATNLFSITDGSEEDVDSIEDMLLQSGIIGGKTNIYSINGQIIRQNTDDLSGLPKGVYIVNGKKYTVK